MVEVTSRTAVLSFNRTGFVALLTRQQQQHMTRPKATERMPKMVREPQDNRTEYSLSAERRLINEMRCLVG